MIVGGVLVAAPPATAAGGPLVYGINPFGNDAANKGLRPFDASTGANVVGHVITIVGGPITGIVDGGNGLAKHPITGTVFAILKVSGQTGRVLATLDLSNGQATTIGNLGSNMAAITFATDGTLYGLNGSGFNINNPCAACLYVINPATADKGTEVAQLIDDR